MIRIKLFSVVLFSIIGVLICAEKPHKYYVSHTDINYSAKDKTLQIISRIFTDDLEKALIGFSNSEVNINPKKSPKEIQTYVRNYFLSKFEINANQHPLDIDFLGVEVLEDGITKCYLESQKIDIEKLNTLSVTNRLLIEYFGEQKNIINLSIKDHKQSFYALKESPTKTFNLK